jgi:hypothetical protein
MKKKKKKPLSHRLPAIELQAARQSACVIGNYPRSSSSIDIGQEVDICSSEDHQVPSASFAAQQRNEP